MKLGIKSYKSELIILIISLIIILTLVITSFTYQLFNSKFEVLSKETATSVCRDFTNKMALELNSAIMASRTIANAFESGKVGDDVVNLSREEAISVLKRELNENPNYFSIFSLWEIGAFDNEDKMYTKSEGSNETGRFVPYLLRNDSGKIELQSLKYTETRNIKSTYSLAKKTFKEQITSPSIFKDNKSEKWLVSFVSPIVYNYKFYGVVGVDITTEYLTKLLIKANLFDNTAKIELISPDGRYAAATTQDTLIGYTIDFFYKDFINQKAQIKNGISDIDELNDSIVIKLPLRISANLEPWQIRFYIPKTKIIAFTKTDTLSLLFWLACICILFISLILIYIVSFFDSINKTSKIAKKIQLGDLTNDFLFTSKYEISTIKNSIADVNQIHKQLVQICNSITLGDFSQSLTPRGEHDELSLAINELNTHLKNAKQLEQNREGEIKIRNWVREGLAELSDILRVNNYDIEKLTFNIITMIVNYLNAEQGALFLLNTNSDTPYLELSSAIAYNKKKYLNKKILLGEGLLGACAIEHETIYITKIPNDYIEITSGMGYSIPASLLIVPLKIENKIIGVLEIASVRLLEKHHINFVERSSDSIALTISSSIANQQTTKLLNQSKIQAEDLSAQEEAMRINLEELEATQEESRDRELEMLGTINAIDATFLIAEIDMDGFYLSVNKKYIDTFGMEKEILVGRNHNEYTLKNEDSEDFHDFWNKLKNGHTIVIEEKITMPGGKEFWLHETYTPLVDNFGIPLKVLKIAYEISNIKEQEINLNNTISEVKAINTDLDLAERNHKMILNAIYENIIEIEIGTDGFVLNVNKNYLNITHLKIEDIIDKSIFDILPVKERKELKNNWRKLLNGESIHFNLERIDQTKMETVNFSFFYTPCLNEFKEIVKILGFATIDTNYLNINQSS